MSYILYSTLGCHLCEQAEDIVHAVAARRDLVWQVKDIADDVTLVEKYGVRIPVIQSASQPQKELGWPFDESALELWLDS